MKNQFAKMLLAVGTISLFGSALHAQTYDLSAKVPFAFQVNNHTFAEGRYAVRAGTDGAVALQNRATGESEFVMGASHTLDGADDARLVFRCYDGRNACFLAEVRPGRNVSGSEVPKSKAEKELVAANHAREVAMVVVRLDRAD